jgi:anti-repressor protein
MVKNYLITKKGIAQLVGGYSSAVPKAFELNVAYINKFEEMEQELKGSVPRSYAEALLEASRLAFENERLLLEQQENAHRIGFAKTIELSEDGILIREFCKILANEGIMLGEKKLYQYLRENGYIFKHSTEATQRAVEQGLFVVNERAIATVNGSKLTFTTKITGKGQLFFLEKLKKEFK